jgi:citrate synthase
MVWEGSVLDANEGIRFHGKTIKDCQKELPKGTSGTEMLPESMFWLLLTGEVPSVGQVRVLSRELAEKAQLPKFVNEMLDAFPKDLHPMTQFACAVSALNYTSEFAKAYEKGINKADYWEPTFNDSISLLAKLPTIAAKIYQNSYRGGGALPAEVDLNQDWSYNFAAMLGKGGKENAGFQDLLRLYLALHGDHEGGNVSAHTTHLVGSALSDAFLSYSAGLQGLAGPLHGLAAQEVLRWIIQMKEAIPDKYTDKDVKDYLWSTLKSGRVVPGYGHAVLRKPDPRFEALMDFAAARPEIANDPVFKLVKANSDIAPGVLTEHGKVNLLSIMLSQAVANQIRRPRTPSPTSIPAPASYSTTTDSPRPYTTLRPSVLAVVLDHLPSLSGIARWVCLLSDPRVSTCRASWIRSAHKCFKKLWDLHRRNVYRLNEWFEPIANITASCVSALRRMRHRSIRDAI